MLIGNRLRILREAKGLTQRDIEKAAGFRRTFVSRVENDHAAPKIETLEKWAKALDIPIYAIFYEEKGLKLPTPEPLAAGESPEDRKFVHRLRKYLGRMEPEDRELLFRFALIVSKQKHSRHRRRSVAKSIVLEDRRREVTIVPEPNC